MSLSQFLLTIVLLLGAHVLALPKRQSESLAPYERPDSSAIVEDTYIVHFQECGYDLQDHMEFLGRNISAQKSFYDMAWLPGYVAYLDADMLLRVRSDPGVLLVECELVYSVDEDDTSPDTDDTISDTPNFSKREYAAMQYENSEYHLRMVASRDQLPTPVGRGSRNVLAYGGEGVSIYVLDTGVRITHEDFEGRASNFRGWTTTPYDEYQPETMDDLDGHGTRVAGIAAGAVYGTAPFANIVNVKITRLSGFGFLESRAATAVNDVTDWHISQRNVDAYRGGILNLSFGTDSSLPDQAMERALQRAARYGLVAVASAGNSGINARYHWPCAHSGTVLCVGGADNSYRKRPDSNYGSVVSLWAPAENIRTISHTSNRGLSPRGSGNSRAVPQASGVGAIMISREKLYNAWTRRGTVLAPTVMIRMADNALRNVIRGLGSGDHNVFVTTGIREGDDRQGEPYVGGGLRAAARKVDNYGQ